MVPTGCSGISYDEPLIIYACFLILSEYCPACSDPALKPLTQAFCSDFVTKRNSQLTSSRNLVTFSGDRIRSVRAGGGFRDDPLFQLLLPLCPNLRSRPLISHRCQEVPDVGASFLPAVVSIFPNNKNLSAMPNRLLFN